MLKYFLRGLLVVVPVVATFYVLLAVFRFVDGLLPLDQWLPGNKLPVGAGVVATVLLVTLIGLLARNFLTGWIFRWAERILTRVPLVKLIYGTTRDLIAAFVGERKSFDKPVILTLGEGAGFEVLGFVTRESLEVLGLRGRIAVYVPQSYNFAGNLLVVPSERVTPLEIDAADVMAFVLSGGVTMKRRA
jgi:uncharacterized membrane protein